MTFLLDTNVLSEVRKDARCDPNVASWFRSVDDTNLYVSVLVLGEIRRGIELLRRRDTLQAMALLQWLNRVNTDFADRILPVDRAVADEWGRLSAIRTIPPIYGLLAATANAYGLTLATRNEGDFAGLGTEMYNPFHPAAGSR